MTKIRDLVREAQAPVAIFLAQCNGLSGAKNAQAGSKVDQTPQQGDRYIRPRDGLLRVIGLEQLASQSRGTQGRVLRDFLFNVAALRMICCNLQQDVFNGLQSALDSQSQIGDG